MSWILCFFLAGTSFALVSATEEMEAKCADPGTLQSPVNGSCPIGTGLGVCKGANDTCGPCPADSFGDGEGVLCRACSPCPPESEMVRPCAGAQDSECRCPRGHYWEHRKCRPCDLCPHGWGVSRQCTSERNTVCRRCPPGTYSGVLSGTRGCVLCSVCKEDQLMLQECNRIQDTICIDKNSNRRYKVVEPRGGAVQDQGQQDIVSHYEPEVIPVYCTVLIPIVLGLVAYFLLRWRLRKTAAAKAGAAACDVDTSFFRQDALLLGKTVNITNNAPNATIVSKQGFVKAHLRQLNPSKRQDLEAALNMNRQDGKDWRSLAWQLGYTDQQTWAWEKTSNPAMYLLSEWSQHPGATVEALSQALFQAGRMDLVWHLQPTCDKLFPPVKGDIV